MPKKNSYGRPTRSPSDRSLKPALLIFTEGQKTEPQYLVHWQRKLRESITIHIDDRHGTPNTLLQYAIDAKRNAARAEKKGRGTPPDQIWCVFDRDDHPYVDEVRKSAEGNGILIAFSNPCFELWLLLHYREQTRWLDSKEAQSEFKHAASLSENKNLPATVMTQLAERYGAACERARKLDELHEGNGNPAGENPSSSVWRLVEAIHDLAR